MKFTFIPFLIAVAIAFTACNNDNKTSKDQSNTSMKSDAKKASTNDDGTEPKAETPTFANVDAKTAASFNEIVDHYLQIKNALTNDNASEAANEGSALAAAISKVDPSTFTPEQKKLYIHNSDDLKENAEHIGKNAGKIEHQREHFAMMSEDVYDLVKGFGSSQPLYQDYCPMAQNEKGAYWLSETKEIHNPYLGKKMPDCGSVEKVIKK